MLFTPEKLGVVMAPASVLTIVTNGRLERRGGTCFGLSFHFFFPPSLLIVRLNGTGSASVKHGTNFR